MMTIAIQMCDVDFFFKNQPIFQNANLTVSPGELVGVFGPNGGGKTTLLKLLMGFLVPRSGSILIHGETAQQGRRRIGYVPQASRMDPEFPITVEELVAMGRFFRRPFYGRLRRDDLVPCYFWMEKLGLLPHKNKAYGELSGGLLQRTLFARALAADPDLLLLDEPTANIDSASLDIFLQTIESLRGKKTILLVTHDFQILDRRVDRFFCVQKQIIPLDPSQLCDHFSLGIYHASSTAHGEER